jgi:hypothetical protein
MRRSHASSLASAVGATAFALLLLATIHVWTPYWIALWQWIIGLALRTTIAS